MADNGELVVAEPLGPPVFVLEHANPLRISGARAGGAMRKLSLGERGGRRGGGRLVLAGATGGGVLAIV